MKSFIYVVSVLCLHFAPGPVYSDDYWPLEVGNRWVYEHHRIDFDFGEGNHMVELKEEVVLEVLSQEEVDGQVYFRLSNGQLLRKDEEGNIIERRAPVRQGESWDTAEIVIFDITHLDDPEYRFYFPYGVFPPTRGGGGTTPYPAARSVTTVSVTAGVFDAIFFAHGDFVDATNIYLGLNVGVVLSQWFSDQCGLAANVLDEEDGEVLCQGEAFRLVRYRVGGKNYPTAVFKDSWGEIKHRFLTP